MKSPAKIIKTVLCISFAMLAFASCEPKEEEPTSSNEPMKASYTYLGNGASSAIELKEELSWEVKANTLTINRKNTNYQCAAANPRLYTEVLNDTIYVIERWYSPVDCNCVSYRDMEITVTNIPKGKWVINNVLEYPDYIYGIDKESGDSLRPRIYIYSHNIFPIEVE